jgi:hypothetical protein
VTIERVGSNKKFSEGWVKAFGGKKKTGRSTASVKAVTKRKKAKTKT